MTIQIQAHKNDKKYKSKVGHTRQKKNLTESQKTCPKLWSLVHTKIGLMIGRD